MEQPATTPRSLLDVLNATSGAAISSNPEGAYRIGRTAADVLHSIRGERTPAQAEQMLNPETNRIHLTLLLGIAWINPHTITGISTADVLVLQEVRRKVLNNFAVEAGRSIKPAAARTTDTQLIYERLNSL